MTFNLKMVLFVIVCGETTEKANKPNNKQNPQSPKQAL